MENARVINLHLHEGCNFHCEYCFAKFGSHCTLPADNWKKAIDNIKSAGNIKRFNLAGGEPLLYPGLNTLIDHIHGLGIEVSVITNGFLLTEKILDCWIGKVSTIGISIDGITSDTIVNTGRCTRDGLFMNRVAYQNLCVSIQDRGFALKINTVISRLNLHEDFRNFYLETKPDRCKLLKMQLFKTNTFSNARYGISETAFNFFTKPYQKAGIPNLVIERTMTNSYFIVDSSGCLLDNADNSYRKLGSFLTETAGEVFKKLHLDEHSYLKRYYPSGIVG